MNASQRTVREVMSELLITVHPETSRTEAAEIFRVNRISGAPVVDGRGVLLGVVSLADLLKPDTLDDEVLYTSYVQDLLDKFEDETGFHLETIPGLVDSCYTRQPYTVHPETSITDAARLMHRHRVHRLIVVNPHEQIPLGIVTSLDLIKVLAQGAAAGQSKSQLGQRISS